MSTGNAFLDALTKLQAGKYESLSNDELAVLDDTLGEDVTIDVAAQAAAATTGFRAKMSAASTALVEQTGVSLVGLVVAVAASVVVVGLAVWYFVMRR